MIGRGIALALIVLVVTAGVSGAAASGEPDLQVALPAETVEPGASTTLSIVVANAGDLDSASTTNPSHTQRVTTARAITVDIDERFAPLTVETSEQLIGSLPDGTATTLPFRVHVAPDAKPGSYDIDVRMVYRYTSRIEDDGRAIERRESVERTLTVTVARTPRFRVVAANVSVRAGESGTVGLTLENVGPAVARESRLTLESPTSDLQFGQNRIPQVSVYTGAWDPDERRTLRYRVHAAEAPDNRSYPIRYHVSYRDANGTDRRSPGRFVGIETRATPTLAIETVSTDLRVDDRGTISGAVVNTGSSHVNGTALLVESLPQGFVPRTGVHPIGDIGPGERASFTIAVDVAGFVEAGPVQFALRPTYVGSGSTPVLGDAESIRAAVAAEQEPFVLSVVNGTVTPDTENYHLTVDLRNAGTVTRRDIVVQLASQPPFATQTPLLAVPELAPGETSRLTFDLSVDEDAVAGTYPVFVNTTSDTLDHRDAVDGPYLLTVTVEEPTRGAMDFTLVGIAALLIVVILGAGWWWLRG